MRLRCWTLTRELCSSYITQRDSITYLGNPIEIVFVKTVARSICLSKPFPLCSNFLLAEISLRFLIFSPISLISASSASHDPIEKKREMGIRTGTNFCQSNEVAQLSRLFSFFLRRNCRLIYNEIHPASPIKFGWLQ